MPKLNDAELVLLAAAAERPDGCILPPPKTLKTKGEALDQLIARLKKKRFITGNGPKAAITDAARKAIGLLDDRLPTEDALPASAAKPAKQGAAAKPAATAEARPKRDYKVRLGSKIEILVNMLIPGATLPELVQATGWQPHSIRGAISGTVRKKIGFEVESIIHPERGRLYRVKL